MNVSTHTPGPWAINGDTVESKAALGLCVAICAEEGTQLSDGSSYTIDAGEALANARLIAAAPELLAALEEIVSYTGGAENALEDEYVMGRAKSAIAKAEGKE